MLPVQLQVYIVECSNKPKVPPIQHCMARKHQKKNSTRNKSPCNVLLLLGWLVINVLKISVFKELTRKVKLIQLFIEKRIKILPNIQFTQTFSKAQEEM